MIFKKITRNNHNAAKLIEKYNDLAREASSNGDKILSENYLQHADHLQEFLMKRKFRKKKMNESENKLINKNERVNEIQSISNESSDNEIIENLEKSEDDKNEKSQVRQVNYILKFQT